MVTDGICGKKKKMSPNFSLHAGVCAEAHVSEDFTVNQSWNVTSDVYVCLSAPPASERSWIYFWMSIF